MSIFNNSRIVDVSRGPDGKVFTAAFELDGQAFNVLNGGPQFKFNEAISMFVNCADQQEVDYLWEKLTADGGQEVQCGWLQDKFGLSWQIVPTALGELMGRGTPEQSGRVMDALLLMKKIDVAGLQRAYDGG